MTLTREQILAADDRKVEPVDVPEWGGTVYVRVMSGTARDAFEEGQLRDGTYANFRARLAVATVCDEAGVLLFTPADLPEVAAKSGSALTRILPAASRVNALTKADIDELAKN